MIIIRGYATYCESVSEQGEEKKKIGSRITPDKSLESRLKTEKHVTVKPHSRTS